MPTYLSQWSATLGFSNLFKYKNHTYSPIICSVLFTFLFANILLEPAHGGRTRMRWRSKAPPRIILFDYYNCLRNKSFNSCQSRYFVSSMDCKMFFISSIEDSIYSLIFSTLGISLISGEFILRSNK